MRGKKRKAIEIQRQTKQIHFKSKIITFDSIEPLNLWFVYMQVRVKVHF
jgi:hypothetical protein